MMIYRISKKIIITFVRKNKDLLYGKHRFRAKSKAISPTSAPGGFSKFLSLNSYLLILNS